jgi:uncharacterized membrane protein
MEQDAKQPVTPTPPRMRGWVRALLVVSLALNLLVVGALAGLAVKGPPWKNPHRPGAQMQQLVGPLTHALKPADRRAIARKVREAGEEIGWDMDVHREGVQKLVNALQAKPFDAELFASSFNDEIGRVLTLLGLAQGALVEHLASMSEEDRADYAARIQEIIDRKKP